MNKLFINKIISLGVYFIFCIHANANSSQTIIPVECSAEGCVNLQMQSDPPMWGQIAFDPGSRVIILTWAQNYTGILSTAVHNVKIFDANNPTKNYCISDEIIAESSGALIGNLTGAGTFAKCNTINNDGLNATLKITSK